MAFAPLKPAAEELQLSLKELVAKIEAGEIDCEIVDGVHCISDVEIDRVITERKTTIER